MNPGQAPLIFVISPLCCCVCVSISSEVEESTSEYQCCDDPGLKFDPKCENSWTINNTPFAHYDSTTQQKTCQSPCKALQDGLLTLDKCVEVIAKSVCEVGEFIEEKSTLNRPKTCSHTTPPNSCQSSASPVLLLLGLMIAVWYTLF